MIDVYKELTLHQYEAALGMLESSVDRCPAENWLEPVVNLKFCQVVFHTLIFTDLYLGRDLAALRDQAFHRDNAEFFSDYEELEDRPQQNVYEKPAIKKYLDHCRGKAVDVMRAETPDSLQAPSGFDWLDFSRAEVHVCNIRHLQHHVAQLSMRLRIDTDDGVPWIKSGG